MKQRIKKTLTSLLIATLPFITFAQSTSIEAAYDTLSIEGQFDHLFKRSNRFEDYKVMRMSSYNALKQNALDSLAGYTDQIGQHQQEIKTLNNKIGEQDNNIKQLTAELEETKQVQDSINILGIQASKEAYNSIMWGLVICLIALSAILFSLYQRGHSVVKATKKRLDEVQDELENHRKNALVREQKLARELMDIKLKNKSPR